MMLLSHSNMIIQWLLILIFRFITETYCSGLVYSMYQLQQLSANKYNNIGDSDSISNSDSGQNQQLPINNSPSKDMICQTFSRHQRKLCNQHFRLMESVVNGFLLGLNECQFQFADQIWNCKGHNMTIGGNRSKSKPRKKGKTYLDKLVSKGTPEAAYVLSVISAGVAHQVTKACSKGVHDSCGCDRTIYDIPETATFKWSGCSHNIHFGAAFTRQFLDITEKTRVNKRPEKALTKLHNNHVGRQAVILKMGKKCKCHGVSGSCEMKTCIRALPDFRVVGDLLKSRFHKAMQVHFVDSRLIPRYSPNRMFTDNDLIYLLKSPNYCVHNPHIGSLGTQGRKCAESALLEKKPGETNGTCEELCCGRGHKKRTFSRMEQCRCKFQWCCDVKCDLCKKDVIESVCD
uniref:Protein Wnt n=1 Tax=Dugesia japonica TaxID=6161 RepID=Q589S7_DUGJA|nr:WNT [Dugesia japonica]